MIVLVIVSLAIGVFWVARSRKQSAEEPPAYPGALPALGHVLSLLGDSETLQARVEQIGAACAASGGVMLLKYFRQNLYVVSDPEDFMTAANQCLQKHYTYGFLDAWLGEGMLITPDTANWRRHRKLLSPSFAPRVLEGFLPVFNAGARQLVPRLAPHAGRGPFDHSHYLDFLSLESIVQTAFGLPHERVQQFSTQAYMRAAQQMLQLATERLRTFYAHSDRLFNLSGLRRRQDAIMADLNNMCDQVLDAKKQQQNTKNNGDEPQKFKAFMDLALELAGRGALSEREVWEEMNNIIVAGYETNGSTLMFTLLLLGSHPEEQDLLYQEIQEIFGSSDRDVEKDDLTRLVFMEAVLKESMRLFCITPVIMRVAEEDVQLKKYRIPAGSTCLLMNCTVSRDAAWGEPALFRPARWLRGATPVPFTGFGVGKRLCLGKNYAMMAMKTALVHVLRRFRVRSEPARPRLRIDPLLKPVSGHHISLDHRTQACSN